MKKRLLKLVMVIVSAIIVLFAFASCGDGKSSMSTNHPQHYEIELNKYNYTKYIKYSVTETVANSLNKNGNFYDFKGVLSYAYYKDVSVTLNAKYTAPSWEGGETYNFTFSIDLDAAGNYSFYTNNQIALDKLNWSYYRPGTESEIVVATVSGKVIFDI